MVLADYVMDAKRPGLHRGIIVFCITAALSSVYWLHWKTFANEVFDTLFILSFAWSLR